MPVSFESLVSTAIGNYLEEKLCDLQIKESYIKHAKDYKQYKGTQAFMQAESKCGPDRSAFKKDYFSYGGILNKSYG